MSSREAPRLVDSPAEWLQVCSELNRTTRLGFDLEADGFHRYPERVALIQISLSDGAVLVVDPLAIENLAPLGQKLSDERIPKVFHSSDYDLRSLDRDFGFHVRGLYDTAIAAQFCGAQRTGLGNVLADFLDVHVDKPKRLQRLDWSRRPLTQEALDYAAGDVLYLLPLARKLDERLAQLGRTDWVEEEFRRQELVRYEPPDPPEKAFLSIRGARKLSGESLAVLRELCIFRDREALQLGVPPYRVMSNKSMIELATNPDRDLGTTKGIRRSTLSRQRPQLEAAVRRGKQSLPVALPRHTGRNPWTAKTRQRHASLKSWRAREANRLNLDRGLVWPAAHLKLVALHRDRPSADLDRDEPRLVRDWQWAELGLSLGDFRREDLGDPNP